MKKEDLNEGRVWAMEYALDFFRGGNRAPLKITDELLSKFNDEDVATINFIRASYSSRAIVLFGIIELMSAYKDEGFSEDEFLTKTNISKPYMKLATSIMQKYKRKNEYTVSPEDTVLDKFKSLLSGNGLNDSGTKGNTNRKGDRKSVV